MTAAGCHGAPWRAVTGRRSRLDEGSGTVWVLTVIGLIWSVAVTAMQVGGARAARHRAYAAADLAALAASAHALSGASTACGLARTIAEESGARLRRCVLVGRVSEVAVTVGVRSVLPVGRLMATARARAGPESLPQP